MERRRRVIVLGGRGLLGKEISRTLKDDFDVYTFDRHGGDKSHIEGSILSPPDLDRAFKNTDIVINLVGLTPLRKPKGPSYAEVHVDGVRNIVNASKKSGVKKIIHVSALGSDKNSRIEYLRTKALGEELIMNSGVDYCVLQPSFIIDIKNDFIAKISKMSFTRVFPKIDSLVQPIVLSDLAGIISMACYGKVKTGTLQVASRDVLSIFDIARKIYNKKGFTCVPAPVLLLKAVMRMMIFLNIMGMSMDQVESLELNNVADKNRAFDYLKPVSFEEWLTRTFR